MQDSLLSIQNLSKSYGKIKALKGLDIEIKPGKVYGLLGPNGSGKSTTLGLKINMDSNTENILVPRWKRPIFFPTWMQWTILK